MENSVEEWFAQYPLVSLDDPEVLTADRMLLNEFLVRGPTVQAGDVARSLALRWGFGDKKANEIGARVEALNEQFRETRSALKKDVSDNILSAGQAGNLCDIMMLTTHSNILGVFEEVGLRAPERLAANGSR